MTNSAKQIFRIGQLLGTGLSELYSAAESIYANIL